MPDLTVHSRLVMRQQRAATIDDDLWRRARKRRARRR
jgi:hypothetical protein